MTPGHDTYRDHPGRAASGDVVAWIDVRTLGVGWEHRIIATNPQYVVNNGAENFAALVIR